MDFITFGNWVRRQRITLDLTQAALARRVGCASVTIKKIERDERRPSRTMAKRLAASLELPEREHEIFVLCGLGELPISRLSRPSRSDSAGPYNQASGTQTQSTPTLSFDETSYGQIQQGILPTESEQAKAARLRRETGQRLERELVFEYKLPQFLLQEAEASPREPVFVGRQAELARLEGRLEKCLAGRGGVLFVIGGMGQGKTTLLQAFARQALQTHPELVVAQGLCNAFAGAGDPFLPFRQALAMLCGDVEDQWLAGEVSTEQAWRLWEGVPDTAWALLAHGKTALQLLVDSGSLAARLKAAGSENTHLASQVEACLAGSLAAAGQVNQAALQEQTRAVLRTVAAQHPLLLLIDDLQWADRASLNLLFHLGRGIAGTPVLILGAYRPEEVQAAGAADEPHPLARLLPEFNATMGMSGWIWGP